MKRLFLLHLLVLAVVALTLGNGCGAPRKFVSGPSGVTPGTEVAATARAFRVGTARVDLTPPPGTATWGHGPDSLIAMGYWTRIQCRIFFFETEDARPLALVPCELQSTSHYLQRLVAEKVRDIVPGSRIFLSSTHTHAGPAHYWEGDAYGGPTSSRYPGFDTEMVEFLAKRIARGIIDAHGGLQPAKLRFLHKDVWGLSRNRSLDAYHLNVHPWAASPIEPSIEEAEDHRMIDPALDVIEISPATGKPTPHGATGVIAFFAMHPTVLSALNRLIGADLYGVSSRAIERELRRVAEAQDSGDVDPLAAIINGNEGDLVPRYEESTHAEAIRVGTAFADHVIELLADATTPFRDHVAIDARFLELDMSRAYYGGEKLCDASLGQAATRGASDHRAASDLLLPDSPDTDVGAVCDAPRARGMGAIQSLIAPPLAYPHFVALGLVRFDDSLVAFVPAELTMTAGHMVDDAVSEVWSTFVTKPSLVRIGGLTNAYMQYVTTPDEYRFQAYEGASTLYGPNTINVFVDRFRYLARSLAGHGSLNRPGTYLIDEVPAIELDTAPERPRFARPSFNVSIDELDRRDARKITGICRLPGASPAAICLTWSDGGPGVVPLTDAPWVSVVTTDGKPVSICGQPYGRALRPKVCDPKATLDDWGMELLVRTTGESCPPKDKGRDGSWNWVALLTPRARDWEDLTQRGSLHLHVKATANHRALDSDPFTAETPPAPCNDVQMRLCIKDSPIECAP